MTTATLAPPSSVRFEERAKARKAKDDALLAEFTVRMATGETLSDADDDALQALLDRLKITGDTFDSAVRGARQYVEDCRIGSMEKTIEAELVNQAATNELSNLNTKLADVTKDIKAKIAVAVAKQRRAETAETEAHESAHRARQFAQGNPAMAALLPKSDLWSRPPKVRSGSVDYSQVVTIPSTWTPKRELPVGQPDPNATCRPFTFPKPGEGDAMQERIDAERARAKSKPRAKGKAKSQPIEQEQAV